MENNVNTVKRNPRYALATRLLNQAKKQSYKKAFQFTNTEIISGVEYQIIIQKEAYMAVALSAKDKIENLPVFAPSEEIKAYPSVGRLFNLFYFKNEKIIKASWLLDDLKKAKENNLKQFEIKLDDTTIYFDYKLLSQMLKLLNVDSKQEITIYFNSNSMSAILIENKNHSFGLCCPQRKEWY